MDTKKMSYDVSAFYVTETHLKNRLKTDVKPGGGILSGGNGPGYQTNDSKRARARHAALRLLRCTPRGVRDTRSSAGHHIIVTICCHRERLRFHALPVCCRCWR